MSAPIVVIANTAGGTSKTTTTHALAVASAEYGKNVLAIDTDPSASLTFLLGIENPRVTITELLQGTANPESAYVKSLERFTVIPSASRAFGQQGDWDWLEKIRSSFDLILIDTQTGPSPALRDLTARATLTVIPVTNSFAALRGALHVMDFLDASSNSSNTSLLPVQSDGLSREFRELLPKTLTIFETAIRRDESIISAETSMRSALSNSPQSSAASDYREVAYSMLEMVGLF